MPNKNFASAQPPSRGSKEDAVKAKRENPDLHVQHEAVLYLKANLECLRGNTVKSLKLCLEARLAGGRSRSGNADVGENEEQKGSDPPSAESEMASSYDEAIYYNNLALVHQSAGKVHVALHYYSIALECTSKVSQVDTDNGKYESASFFWSDGATRPDIATKILNNASVCAFQACDFKRSFGCMAKCIAISPELFGKRARCWLRLGQSLMGGLLRNKVHLLEKKEDSHATPDSTEEDFWANPLPRAASYLYKAIYLFQAPSATCNIDLDCYETSLLSLAYIKMEMNDPVGALEACDIMLRDEKPRTTIATLRRRATCKVYAAEALCLLDDAKAASSMLFGSDEIEEAKMKADASSSDSPLYWLAQGFSIENKKKSSESENNTPADIQLVQVKELIENRVLLHRLLEKGDTESAIVLLRGGQVMNVLSV